ncbi:MAG: Imm1 family immunity protein [Rhizomicrobium sp.]
MNIEDFRKKETVNSFEQIVAALASRYGDEVNAFWLRHSEGKFPALHVVVNGDFASLHYFPAEGHPGLRSIGMTNSLPSGGATTFFMTSLLEPELFPNRFVVPFSVAQEAAIEFFKGAEPPGCIHWFEL